MQSETLTFDMGTAPILLFTYKRLEPLKQTVEALQQNHLARQSDLYIFSDGPKSGSDAPQIEKIRSFLGTVDGFKSVNIESSEKNKGLATSIITGVTKVFELYDRVIVLEDDLLTTPNFLKYMNDSLNFYENASKAFSISAYSFNLKHNDDPQSSTYFLNRGWSWGWGTWKDRWETVDWEVKDYHAFSKDKKRKKEFAKGGSDLNKMLEKQMTGQLDSWAIRWFYHQYKIGGLTLYPLASKIYNNGFDSFATHTSGSDKRYLPYLDTEHQMNFDFPEKVDIHNDYQKRFSSKMGIWSRIRSKLETVFK